MRGLIGIVVALLVAGCGGGPAAPPAGGSPAGRSPVPSSVSGSIPPAGASCAPGTNSSGGSGPTCRFPLTFTGSVDFTWKHLGEIVYTAAITNIKWQYDPAESYPDVSVYKLVGGTITWRFDDSDPEAGCGTIEWHGGGTDTVVPDEPRDTTPLEAGGGMPDEAAFLQITWADPDPARQVPYYGGSGIARLHDKIKNHYSCGGEVREIDPNFMGQITKWLFLPYDPPRVAADQRLAGTWDEDVVGTTYTYTWDFREGP